MYQALYRKYRPQTFSDVVGQKGVTDALRAQIETEISPMVGNEQQSEDLVQYLLGGYESDPEKLWESNIFGRSVFELVNEGLNTKLKRMPEDARYKLKDALTKIFNEGANGLICLMF